MSIPRAQVKPSAKPSWRSCISARALPATEQPMLDDLVVAAVRGPERRDVEGYWFDAPIGGMTLAQAWWPYSGTAIYGGQTEPLY